MDVDDLAQTVADLRSEGSDFAEVEVKKASGGFPRWVAPTLSAFANTPGGGTLIFGLDESNNFKSVGVYDIAACKAALASVCRLGIVPPISHQSWDVSFEGKLVVVAKVDELAGSVKPCRVSGSQKAYLRAYDGDYELSQLEEQSFIANRETPRFDQAPVPGTSRADLDGLLVDAYIASCKSSSAPLARMEDEEVLFRTGVIAPDRNSLTLAGLLSLGIYPQQYFPNLVIQASVAPGPNDPPGTRAVDPKRFDGPIPLMLDQALHWVRRNTRSRVRFGSDGHGRDEPEYPAEAVRELLSNALVHRDLGPYALGEAITLKLDRSQLVLSNPGGLWGLTVSRLGTVGVTSARNGYVVRICQNVRLGRNQRVIEALASGIPTVLSSLREAGMVPPRFHDQGVRFTVLMPNHTLLASEDLEWLSYLNPLHSLSDIQRHALVAMKHGLRWTNKSLRETFPMDSLEARNTLADLVDAGVAEAIGKGGGRIYQLSKQLREVSGLPIQEAISLGQEDEIDGHIATSRRKGARRENAERIMEVLARAPSSSPEIRSALGLSERQTLYALDLLREESRVVLDGGQGVRTSKWRLS